MTKHRDKDIAIVGMACKFPGGANTPQGFVDTLLAGLDCMVDVPEDRWDKEYFFSKDSNEKGKIVNKRGGFLDNINSFDNTFFGITPVEATTMDPQQRMALQCTWNAFEHAGLKKENLLNSDTGVFFGVSGLDYAGFQIADPKTTNSYSSTGVAHCIVANRISYLFGLKGPSYTIDSACSSSITALSSAMRSIQAGDCKTAVVGSINLLASAELTAMISQSQFLSPDGNCKTFDEKANGYVRGEGCGVVVVKSLNQAIHDGDQIHAVIKGVGVNQDGRSNGLTAPNGPSQEEVIEKALADADLNADDVSYIETHGTGTPLGDPIEIAALNTVYGKNKNRESVVLGAVKANIGHLETAAGLAGLIKAVQLFKEEYLPKQIKFDTLNPKIDLENSPFIIPKENIIWPEGYSKKVVGLSSFGFGGTNGHVIFEEYLNEEETSLENDVNKEQIICLSIQSKEALVANQKQWIADIKEAENVSSWTKAWNYYRGSHNYRTYVKFSNKEELLLGLQQLTLSDFKKVKNFRKSSYCHEFLCSSTKDVKSLLNFVLKDSIASSLWSSLSSQLSLDVSLSKTESLINLNAIRVLLLSVVDQTYLQMGVKFKFFQITDQSIWFFLLRTFPSRNKEIYSHLWAYFQGETEDILSFLKTLDLNSLSINYVLIDRMESNEELNKVFKNVFQSDFKNLPSKNIHDFGLTNGFGHEDKSISEALGELYKTGLTLDYGHNGFSTEILNSLSQYQFSQIPFWVETSLSKVREFNLHTEVKRLEGRYVAEVDSSHPYLVEHQVNKIKVIPGMALIDIAYRFLKQLKEKDFELQEVTFLAPGIALKKENLILDIKENQNVVEIFSKNKLLSQIRFGMLQEKQCAKPKDLNPIEIRKTPSILRREDLYATFEGLGFEYGSQFKHLQSVRKVNESIVVETDFSSLNSDEFENILFVSPILDAALQAVVGFYKIQNLEGSFIPFKIQNIHLWQDLFCLKFIRVKVIDELTTKESKHYEISLFDDNGKCVGLIENFCSKPLYQSKQTNSSAVVKILRKLKSKEITPEQAEKMLVIV